MKWNSNSCIVDKKQYSFVPYNLSSETNKYIHIEEVIKGTSRTFFENYPKLGECLNYSYITVPLNT